MREHINLVGAQIAYTVAMSNADKSSRHKLKFNDFRLDYKKASKSNSEVVAMELDKVLGDLAKNGRK